MTTINPGAGPAPLPGIPYTFRGFAEDSPDGGWRATLVMLGRAIARVERSLPGASIHMVFAEPAEQTRFEGFARRRAQVRGESDEQEMRDILERLAAACRDYRRVSKLASRYTVVQLRGEPGTYHCINTKRTPELEASLRTRLGPRLLRVVTPSKSTPGRSAGSVRSNSAD